jgi:hypothetical protein
MMIIRHRQERDRVAESRLAAVRGLFRAASTSEKSTSELKTMEESDVLSALKDVWGKNMPEYIMWAAAMGSAVMLAQKINGADRLDRDTFAKIRKYAAKLYDKSKEIKQ